MRAVLVFGLLAGKPGTSLLHAAETKENVWEGGATLCGMQVEGWYSEGEIEVSSEIECKPCRSTYEKEPDDA